MSFLLRVDYNLLILFSTWPIYEYVHVYSEWEKLCILVWFASSASMNHRRSSLGNLTFALLCPFKANLAARPPAGMRITLHRCHFQSDTLTWSTHLASFVSRSVRFSAGPSRRIGTGLERDLPNPVGSARSQQRKPRPGVGPAASDKLLEKPKI